MLKNNLKIALRTLWKHKQVTLINVIGLSVGMAACVLILLFVQYELSYDRYHENADRIYRLSREWRNADGETSLHLGHLASPFAPFLANDFPKEIESIARLLNPGGTFLVNYEAKDVQMVESDFYFAESAVFDIFSFPLAQGSPETALSEPGSVVVTESTARKYFGDEDPIGKTLLFPENGLTMQVTGVARDVPANSHFHFNMLGSFATLENFMGKEAMMTAWDSNSMGTYLLLSEDHDPDALEAQFPDFFDRHLPASSGNTKTSESNFLHLWPVTDIHLHSHLDSEMEDNGNITYVYLYTIIALFILAIACINFVNLSTARAGRRAKEVGVRKVMGAVRGSLIRQFLSESVLIAVFSLVVALLLVEIALPFFNDFVGQSLSVNIFENAFVLVLLVAIVVVVGVVAGSYPAFFLSSFLPAKILKSGSIPRGQHAVLRSGLVVLQFAISIVLIIGVFTVENQLDYVKSKSLGFNRDNLLAFPFNDKAYQQYEQLKPQLLQQPGIRDVTITSRVPSGDLLDNQGGTYEIKGEMRDIDFRLSDVHVDHDFLTSFQIDLVAGRNFDINRASDSTEAYILNETAVRTMGWDSPEEAVGQELQYGGQTGYIVGVAQDFHFQSLHQTISPVLFQITEGRARSLIVRIDPAVGAEVVSSLKEQWAYLMPGIPFEYYTISDQFDAQYAKEDKLGQVVQLFSVLALLIAALGLVGMASYVAEQRTKEVGIRKVLGASVGQILLLLTRGFSKLVLVAFVIASPLAYWLMSRWLGNFAYHDSLNVGIFVVAGGIALLVAWLTVGSQTFRAATRNPVDSLRNE